MAALSLLLIPSAWSQLSVEVLGSGQSQIPVAIPDFVGSEGKEVSSVIRQNLALSGLFKITGGEAVSKPTGFSEWSSQGIDALVLGTVGNSLDDVLSSKVKLFDIPKKSQITGETYAFNGQHVRTVGHKVSDLIFEKLTGKAGIFSTKLAYVAKNNGKYIVMVSDFDGKRKKPILISREPIISISWSPDASKLLYVSFEQKKPIVYLHEIATKQRRVIANYRGSNSSPAWSSDGSHIALVLTRDGYSQIYLLKSDGSGLKRLTHTRSIDTEPSFSPDGKKIYFTSDRSGSPQIYTMNLDGSNVRRVTFEGSYNITPVISPDDPFTMVYIRGHNGKYQVALMDLRTGTIQVLTDSRQDESPSFSPNGRMIIYSTEKNRQRRLDVVSVDGMIRQTLTSYSLNAKSPSWGPFSK